MTARYVDFKAGDLKRLLKEESVAYMAAFIDDEVAERLEQAPHTFSIEVNGEVMAMGGVTEYWQDRGEAWIFFDSRCKENFVPVFRLTKKWVHECPVRRIEAAAEVGAVFAHRHLFLLGFQMEAPYMAAFRPDGVACSLYARVK